MKGWGYNRVTPREGGNAGREQKREMIRLKRRARRERVDEEEEVEIGSVERGCLIQQRETGPARAIGLRRSENEVEGRREG